LDPSRQVPVPHSPEGVIPKNTSRVDFFAGTNLYIVKRLWFLGYLIKDKRLGRKRPNGCAISFNLNDMHTVTDPATISRQASTAFLAKKKQKDLFSEQNIARINIVP